MHSISHLIADLRHGVRSIRRRPHTAVAAILVAGLGVGCALAVLAFAYHVYLDPLPFPRADRLISVARQTPEIPFGPTSVPEFEDWRERQRSFQHLAMVRSESFTLQPTAELPVQLQGSLVSWSMLRILGLAPVLGRDLEPEDDLIGASPVALVSHAFWQTRLGGRADAIGQSIRLDGRLVTVVGVLPSTLDNVPLLLGIDLGAAWLPISLYFNRESHPDRANRGINTIGRLADSVSFEQVRDDLSRIRDELSKEYPQTNRQSAVVPVRLRDNLMAGSKAYVLALFGAAGLVLIATVVNLGNLALASTLARRRELATRQALGAERSSVASHLFAESAVLAIAGAALGLLVATSSASLIRALMPASIGRDFATLSLPVLAAIVPLVVGFVVCMSIPSVLFVTGPGALRLVARTRSGGDGRGGRRLRRYMVIAEVAVAAALLVGAGLLAASLSALGEVDPGFRAASLSRFKITPDSDGPLTHADRLAFVDRLLNQLEAIPGVDGAALSSQMPLDALARISSRIAAGDRPQPELTDMDIGTFLAVSPTYFRVMGIPQLRGRSFDRLTDVAEVEPSAVIISESLARSYWPGPDEDPTRHQLGFEFLGSPAEFTLRMRSIVGVVGDVPYQALDQPVQHAVYAPLAQPPTYFEPSSWPALALAVRSTLETEALAETIRGILATLAPGVALYDLRTMTAVLDDEMAQRRHLSSLVQALATLAALLAAIGIYGVIAAAVAAERREIGVRAALGAQPGGLVGRYLLRAAGLIAAGLAIGLALAITLAPRVMGGLLFGITPHAPAAYATSIGVLTMIALFAALVPALRAARVPPTEVLRDL